MFWEWLSAVDNLDTDHTGQPQLRNGCNDCDGLHQDSESTTRSCDKDYTGFGITYDMGGATLKAGMVEDNDISSMDIGVSFSF